MPKPVYLLGYGILCSPESNDTWTDLGVTWIMGNNKGLAEKIEPPRRWPSTSRFFLKHDARLWLDKTADYITRGHKVIWAGHSNGCRTICKALTLDVSFPRLEAVHLFSPACDWELEYNGIGPAIRAGKIGCLHIYCAGHDRALGLAAESWWGRWIAGWCRYKTLGLHGPREGVFEKTTVHWMRGGDHSDWWKPDQFETSMRRIVEA